MVPDHFEPLQRITFSFPYAGFPAGDGDLLTGCIHPRKVGEQKAAFLTTGDDDTVAFHIQIVLRWNRFRFAQYVYADIQSR